MSEIDTRLAALRAARDSGVLTVRHGETSTTYRSLDEINTIIRDLEHQGGVKRTRIRYIYQDRKGY